MSLKIGSHSFFSCSSKENKESLSSSTNTDKKAAAVANRVLEKSNTTWYIEKIKLPLAQNGNLPVTARLSPDTVHMISLTENQGPKLKPTPLPRSHTTCLSLTPERPEMGKQKKAFESELSAILNAKNALKPTKKKTPPFPPPQENKPKFEPTSVPTPILPSERRVSFTNLQGAAKDRETNSPETSSTFAIKSILKKTPSFSNTEENIKPKEEAPKKELTDEWAEVYRMLNECSEFLK